MNGDHPRARARVRVRVRVHLLTGVLLRVRVRVRARARARVRVHVLWSVRARAVRVCGKLLTTQPAIGTLPRCCPVVERNGSESLD